MLNIFARQFMKYFEVYMNVHSMAYSTHVAVVGTDWISLIGCQYI